MLLEKQMVHKAGIVRQLWRSYRVNEIWKGRGGKKRGLLKRWEGEEVDENALMEKQW